MKMRKVISLFSALAMAATMFTAFATSASATVTAKSANPSLKGIAEQELDTRNRAVFDFTLTQDEVLSYFNDEGYITSNGINMIQVKLTLDENVFDVAESATKARDASAMVSTVSGINMSGNGTNSFTFLFAPTSVDGYMTVIPTPIFQVKARLKDGYTLANIPNTAITFGECIVEFTSYDDCETSDGATTYTIYSINPTGSQPDFPLVAKFGEDKPVVTEHSITVTGGTADVAKAAAGATVTVTPTIATGYQFKSISGSELEYLAIADGKYTFVMPDKDVAVTVETELIPATKYAVNVTGGTANVASAEAGAIVTVTPTVPANKVVDTVKVNGTDVALNNGAYTFTMPEAIANVVVTFKNAPFTSAVGTAYTLHSEKCGDLKAFDCTFSNTVANKLQLTFSAEGKTLVKQIELSAVAGGANTGFTALVLGAPDGITLNIADVQ